MRSVLIALLFLVLPAARLLAESTPEQMVTLYFDSFKKGDFETIAINIHDEELEKFKESVFPAIERSLEQDPVGASRDAAALRYFMGKDSIEVVREEPPREFFIRFMKWIAQLNPVMMTGMSGATIQTLGFIPEKDMAHTVFRVDVDMMGAQFSQMKVMSVKKQGEEWKLMLTGEIHGMAKMFERQTPPMKPSEK